MRLRTRVCDTLKNTHFSINPVMYTFETDFDIGDIKDKIGGIGDIIFKRVRRYSAMTGYCRANRLTLFTIAWSVRFWIIARPFRAYMYRVGGKTRISGNFRFSLTTKIIAFAWLLNDTVRFVNKICYPSDTNFFGHIISVAILSAILARTVWQDKKQQQSVIEFMQNELGAKLVK